jgi:hypothetical protein
MSESNGLHPNKSHRPKIQAQLDGKGADTSVVLHFSCLSCGSYLAYTVPYYFDNRGLGKLKTFTILTQCPDAVDNFDYISFKC